MIRIYNEKTGAAVEKFTANKTEYHILMPDKGISVFRAQKLRELLPVVAVNSPVGEILETLDKMQSLFDRMTQGKGGAMELGAEIFNMRKKVIDNANREWSYAEMACTFFIVTKDEDLTKWDERQAQKKISDWNKAGIYFLDFFFCAMQWDIVLTRKLQEFYVKYQ